MATQTQTQTWQWMDNHHGPMGWFSDEEKREHFGAADFRNGTWREVSEEEVRQARQTNARLYYEQS